MNNVKDLFESELCPFAFYLTGSKFFGYDTEESDTDYMVEHTLGIEEFLDAWGFTKKENLKHINANVHSVWKHNKEDVHVQVLLYAYSKWQVQRIMKKWLTADEIKQMFSKDDLAYRMWDMLLEIRGDR